MTRIFMRSVLGAAVCVAALSTQPAAAQKLAPHRAVYDIDLDEASDRSGIIGMKGRIVYEFQGSRCDGYTTNYRFVSRIRSSSGDRLTDQQTSTYEDGEGETFRFVTKTFVDERLDRELSGSASLEDDSLVVELRKPEPTELVLETALFPTAHINDLLARADAGETVYEKRIFDGSDDGDKTMTTTVVLGPEKTGTDGDAENAGPLRDNPFRNVSISYFDESSETDGEMLPEYAISFKLYRNGVTRDLVMDYGDFSLTGELATLELFPLEDCQ
ncbi:cell envelope integrity EipB family protein [Oricola sp.]|uniref:cell envelope integrity EipB family protein n=1 Tax=Oricola sp. TaxID=1979950 RepID=UPI003BA89700